MRVIKYNKAATTERAMFFALLIVLIALIGVVMSLVILLQAGKGGGLAGIAGGGATTQILGARQAPDILEKGTWILATLFIVLCILTNFAIDSGDSQRSIIQSQSTQQAQPDVIDFGDENITPAPVPETPTDPVDEGAQ